MGAARSTQPSDGEKPDRRAASFAAGMRNAGERLTLKPISKGPAEGEDPGNVQTRTLIDAGGTPKFRQTRRARLLVDATREFSRLARPSAEEIGRYKELFYELIAHVAAGERRLVSAMLARYAYTPRAIALYLAQDEIEIAAPFLLFCPVLGEIDLDAIGEKKGMRYRDVIARRKRMATGSGEAGKAEASQAVTTQDVAEKTVPLEAAQPGSAASLPEMPFSGEPQVATQSDLSSQTVLALAGTGGKLGRRNAMAGKSVSGDANPAPRKARTSGVSVEEMRRLLHHARTSNHMAFGAMVEEICGLETSATIRLMGPAAGDEFLYLIKALGVPSPHDLQMMLLVVPSTGRSIEAYRRAKQLLRDLDTGICRMIFNEIGARFALPGERSGKRDMELEAEEAEREAASDLSGETGFPRAGELVGNSPRPRAGAGASMFEMAVQERRRALGRQGMVQAGPALRREHAGQEKYAGGETSLIAS